MICRVCGLDTQHEYQHANEKRCIAELRAALFRTQLDGAAAQRELASTMRVDLVNVADCYWTAIAHHPV